MKLVDQHILITGGAGDIGYYLVEKLSILVNKITILDINDSNFEKFDAHKNVDPIKCDVTDFNAVSEVINKIYDNGQKISILINNAGWIYSAPLVNLFSKEDKKHSFSEWDKAIKTNLYSTFNVGTCIAEKFVVNRTKGLIINISSIAAKGNPGQTAYSAAKGGVESLTLTWGRELANFGIRVAGIAPGFFDTPSTHSSLKENVINNIVKSVPLKRMGTAEEIFSSVKFIIENDYYNGRILEIDGGLNIV